MRETSLSWSSSDFTIDRISYEGLPIFVDPITMQIEMLPTEFCIYVAVVRGRSRSPKTWKAYGHILLAYIRYMAEQRFNWKDPTEEQIAHYRNSLEKRHLTRSRIARVMSIVCAFYEWSYDRGYIKALPLTFTEVQRATRGILSRPGETQVSSRAILVPNVPTRRRLPRYFNRSEQEAIISGLDERDRLVVEWALYTGIRQFELCALTLDQLPPQSAYRSRRVFPLRLRTTKGSAPADLYVPVWLLDKTHQYMKFFGRAQIVRSAASRRKASKDAIFLARWGDPLRPNSVYRNFKGRLKAVGLHGTFHDLRHTYAISTLDALMRSGKYTGTDGHNALLELRTRMRHASLNSTMIYLRAREFYLAEIFCDLWETA